MCLFFICRCNCCLKITDIIQAVKNADDINAVCHGFLHEILDHIVCIRTVAKDILSAEKHLKLCIFEAVAELSQSLPRILFEETQGCVKCSAAPALYCVVSHFVHLVDDREHLLCCHPCSDQ